MWCMHGNVYQRQCCQYYYKSLTCTDVTDNDGKTPFDWAVQNHRTEVSEYLGNRPLDPA